MDKKGEPEAILKSQIEMTNEERGKYHW